MIAMDARKKIEEEKLFNILNPKKANNDFKITIKFQKHLSPKYQQALKLASQNKYFLEEGTGNAYKAYASFYPEDTESLHQLFDLVHQYEDTEIFLNNKRIPYIQDLWLFLMWFYKQ
jgi:hypothetical protein